jgi:type IV secretory pathway protease TraF
MIARARTLAIMLVGVSATVSPGLADRSPWLVCNASASVPIGLYVIHTVDGLRVGELVVIRPPEPLASFLADRGYLPRGVPLVKHVAALPGQSVCRNALTSALTRSRSAKPASATVEAVRCPPGRAVGSSP